MYPPEESLEDKQGCCTDSEFLWKDNIVWQFFRDSSLHGFKYVGMWERGIVERVFWSMGILGCMGFSVYLIQIGVVEPLSARPVLISFQSSEITIDQIPFPAITICNVNKVKKSVVVGQERKVRAYEDCSARAEETGEDCDTLFNQNRTATNALICLQYVGNLCKRVVSFAKTFNYSFPLGRVQFDLEKDYNWTNMTLDADESPLFRQIVAPVLKKAMMSCAEMIILCLWQNTKYDCSDLFYAVQTEFGRCCVFNMVPQVIMRYVSKNSSLTSRGERNLNDSVLEAWSRWNIDERLVQKFGHWEGLDLPRHQQVAGMNTGLSILVNPRLDEYHCNAQDSEGFRVLTHSPIDSPHISEFGKGVEPNSEVFVGVKAEITVMDESIKDMPFEKRKCYLQGEFTLKTSKFYTETNCLDECVANITYEECGCLRYYQPRERSRETCGGTLDACVSRIFLKIEKEGIDVKCPVCYPSCTDIQYYMESNSLPMRADAPIWKNHKTGLDEKWSNSNLSIIHFYFTSDYVESRVRKSLYGFRQVLANAGGLLGLAIGFSIVSAVEPLYFLTLRYLFSYKGIAGKEGGTVSEDKLSSSSTSPSIKKVRKNSNMKIIVKPEKRSMAFGYLP